MIDVTLYCYVLLFQMNGEVNRCARSLTESLIGPAKKGEMVEMKE